MNELEIARYLCSDKYTSKLFKGIYARDQLEGLERGLYVVNTDVSTGPGKHWICLFLNDTNEYFDSLGLPPVEVKSFLDKQSKPYLYSNQRLQGHDSDVCGDYCILYAYFKCRGWTLKEFVNLFTSNLSQNDVMVEM